MTTQTHKRGLAGNPWYNHVPERWHGSALGISAAQSWNTWTGERGGVKLIPMLWGHMRTYKDGRTVNLWGEFMRTVPMSRADWIITFNEPADAGQANMTPETAAWIWTDLAHHYPQAKLTSPQMLIGLDNASGFNFFNRARDWLMRWWQLLPDHVRPRLNAWAWHCYHSDPTTMIEANGRWMAFVDGLAGGKQHWVTEWGVNRLAHPNDASATNATSTIANYFDGHADRHFYFTNKVDDFSAAWSGYNLVGDDGKLTAVGRGWVGVAADRRYRMFFPFMSKR